MGQSVDQNSRTKNNFCGTIETFNFSLGFIKKR